MQPSHICGNDSKSNTLLWRENWDFESHDGSGINGLIAPKAWESLVGAHYASDEPLSSGLSRAAKISPVMRDYATPKSSQR